ncbi:fibronectin type-III domain-containing protein 3A-like isoform X4 [Babylonia areolata]|uniref:fibronectin type-III domain-containing protein 3A-like isoform X4 n=1 Tax=Babylonia areolata TaxID=304850 RepID=UPI003FD476B1
MKGGEGYPQTAPHHPPVYLAPPPPTVTATKVMCSLCIEEYATGYPYPGPATVRMVSSNGPPVPMPMQVPPGHMVQQIVDEHGILTHVILSPQPPMPSATPMTGGPSNAQQYYPAPYAPHYPSGPQYPSHHHPHPHPAPHNVHPHMHSGIPPHIQSPSPHTCSNHAPVHPSGASPPLNSSDDRTLRQRNRVRKKIQQRRPNEGYYPQQGRHMGRRRGGGGVNGEIHHGNGGHCNSLLGMENGPVEPEEDTSLIIQYLSNMPPPKVTDIESRSALIQLSPPEYEAPELDVDLQDCRYELLLSDKGRDAKYKTVFCGDATEITLKDLKPALEYHLKVSALLNEDLKGALTDPVSFRTSPCEPERPQPPKMMNKTKTSLQLKWNATCENGSKISTYSLECDQGQGENSFVEVYNGLNRQFRLNRLTASTRYLFRVAAINSMGKSAWSEVASFFTSGSVPSQPDPPMLSEQFVYGLTISWIKRPNEDEFILQMEDEATGHGFIPVYNGPNLSYPLRHLRRNTEYRFRLSAKNDEGPSKWSDTVTFRTLPDRPLAPCKPQIKGKVLSHAFRITWEPPTDDGGADISKYIVELDDGQGYETVYEGCDREHQFEQLTPGHQYRVRVACCNVGGRSEFSDCCLATTQPIAPGQCQAPKLQGKPKATSLHLRWSYPDYDGGSQVTQFAAQMISPDNTMREVYKGHDLDCIVAGLSPGRPYLFQVRAFNRAGQAGPWSELLEVVSGAGAPDAPRSPQLTCRSPHSALVTWDEPFHNGATISEYRLEWTQTPDAHDFSQLYVGPNLSYEAKGLTPATTYTFRVQALNTAGIGPYSPAVSCQTPSSSPGSVMSVRWQAGPTSVQLWWRPPPSNGSDLLSYNISLSDRQVITVDPVSEYTLDNLQPETTYKIRIQAVNGIGVGPYSTVTKVTTRPLPPTPPKLECLSAAPNSLKLKWGDGRNPDQVRYTLEMEKEDGSFQAVYSGPAHTHKVNRLSEMSSYEFRIFASNDAGHGPYSDTITFTTSKAPPPALRAARVDLVKEHQCQVEWQSCRSQGSDPVTYILQLQRPHSADHEYRQVYKGPNTQFTLDGLDPGTEYQVRVCAVRESSDGSAADIAGPFSPGTHFSTPNPTPQRRPTPEREAEARRTSLPQQWTDQQWAAVILLCFVVLAILTAIVTQQVIAYLGAPPPASPSSHFPSSGRTN